MKSNRRLATVMLAISLFTLCGPARAAEELVELRLQRAKCICGVVTAGGDLLRHAKVEEFGPDWKEVLRSTDTDEEGRFTLAPVEGRKIYYLQISARVTGVNPLRVPVQVVHFRGVKLLHLRLVLA